MVYLDFAGFKRRNQTFEAMGLEPERGFLWTRTIRQAEGSILFLDISETFASHMTPAPTQLTGPAQVLPRRCWADFLVSRRLGGQASMHSFHKHKVVGARHIRFGNVAIVLASNSSFPASSVGKLQAA